MLLLVKNVLRLLKWLKHCVIMVLWIILSLWQQQLLIRHQQAAIPQDLHFIILHHVTLLILTAAAAPTNIVRIQLHNQKLSLLYINFIIHNFTRRPLCSAKRALNMTLYFHCTSDEGRISPAQCATLIVIKHSTFQLTLAVL